MSNQINDGGPAFGVDEVIPGVIVGHDLFNLRNVGIREAGQPMAMPNALSIRADEVQGKGMRESCSKSDRAFRDGRKLKDGLQRVRQKDELAVKRWKINRRIIAAQPRRFNGVALQGMQYSTCDF